MSINSHSPIVCNTLLNQDLAISKTKSSTDKKVAWRVWQVVKPVFLESFVSVTLNLGVLSFFATPVSIPLFVASVAASLGLSVLFAWRDFSRQQKMASKETNRQLKATQLLSKGAIVNTVGLSKPNIIIHESGHFLAAKILFKESHPKIWINPFQGGGTSYTASNRLTCLGRMFGKSGSMLVTAAAGLAASTLYICSELAIAHKMQKKHPNVSQYMNLHAISHLFNEVLYGLTAFVASKKDLGHDLVRLWCTGGIHPAIPIGLLIAFPLIDTCLCYKVSLVKNFIL